MILTCLDVMEVTHTPIEEAVADGAARVDGGQNYHAVRIDEPGVQARSVSSLSASAPVRAPSAERGK